ncbi:MAG: methylmalonyl Co-A mutase-associated GTPase MeaB [Deltaproteobacteria bacterium]|nr:methylmalonyl Co-A mutase-associated GTPase MeaB [Deltaproteobacteria bacterium]
MSKAGEVVKRLRKGDARAVARCLTLIENGDPGARSILKELHSRSGRAHIVGVTGAPGTGKSTLISSMTAELRRRKKRVAVLTVDPTGPFSGGALLGDRIRMREHFLDEGVFIRSLATRGSTGGVAASIRDAACLLDAAGNEIVLIETIGVGQDQVQVKDLAHTVVVIVIPRMGDEIQGMKAGLLEIADILVINKADLPGADEAAEQLRGLFGESGVPILKTAALENVGVGQLIDTLEEHYGKLQTERERGRTGLDFSRSQLLSLLRDRLLDRLVQRIGAGSIEAWAEKVAERRLDAHTAAEKILKSAGF